MTLARKLAFCLARTLPRFVDADALESDAMLGLVQAARTFDPDRGVSFATYANRRIRGAMLDGLRERQHLRQTEIPIVFVSLDNPIGSDDDGRPATLGDVLPNGKEPVGAAAESREEVAKLLRPLDPRDAQSMQDRYLYGATQQDIALRRGLSPSRISQRLKESRHRLAALGCPSNN